MIVEFDMVFSYSFFWMAVVLDVSIVMGVDVSIVILTMFSLLLVQCSPGSSWSVSTLLYMFASL